MDDEVEQTLPLPYLNHLNFLRIFVCKNYLERKYGTVETWND